MNPQEVDYEELIAWVKGNDEINLFSNSKIVDYLKNRYGPISQKDYFKIFRIMLSLEKGLDALLKSRVLKLAKSQNDKMHPTAGEQKMLCERMMLLAGKDSYWREKIINS
jgi:hypothetical protein